MVTAAESKINPASRRLKGALDDVGTRLAGLGAVGFVVLVAVQNLLRGSSAPASARRPRLRRVARLPVLHGTAPRPQRSEPGMSYPHTIDNGAGERLTFLRRVRHPGGDRLEVESLVKPGAGPPMHVHHYQEEALTVEQGRLAYQRPGEPPRFAGPGETVAFGPGEAHRFWNPGDEDLRLTGHIQPADNIEYLLSAIYESQRQAGGSRPDPFEAAFLTTRYRSEFGMAEVPAPVQRLVFPALVIAGRLLGKYRKHVQAPEPVIR